MDPHNTTDAVQDGQKSHISPIITRMPGTGTRYIEIPGESSRRIIDPAVDNDRKRKRGAVKRMEQAGRHFVPNKLIWEFRLTLPPHLDILVHEDVSEAMQTIWRLVDGEVTYARLEDVRSLTTEPTEPHMHGATQAPLHQLVGSIPGLWVRPLPLDPFATKKGTRDQPTLYGLFHYLSKSNLDGANRRKSGQLHQHGHDQALREHAAAIDRFIEAQQRAWGKGRDRLPRTSEWLNTEHGTYCRRAYERVRTRYAA